MQVSSSFTHLTESAGLTSLAEGITVTLDQRTLKTPSGNVLVLPHRKHLIAALIAHEWENQEKALKPHALPMVLKIILSPEIRIIHISQTSLASRAIDGLQEQKVREEVHEALLSYFDTDTIWYAGQ